MLSSHDFSPVVFNQPVSVISRLPGWIFDEILLTSHLLETNRET
jgi:hypothetical protein